MNLNQRARGTHCQAGHDRRKPGALYADGQCRECKRIYNDAQNKVRRQRTADKRAGIAPPRGPEVQSMAAAILSLWQQLEHAPAYEKADIRRRIHQLQPTA